MSTTQKYKPTEIVATSHFFSRSGHIKDEDRLRPNTWFAQTFPTAVREYNEGFLEKVSATIKGYYTITIPHLNEDAWARALGGEAKDGNSLIYYRPEGKFYFYDLQLNAYTVTTEENCKLLLSNYLLRCANQCNTRVDLTTLIDTFRSDNCLDRIITKAKLILARGPSFFAREGCPKRIPDTMPIVEPKASPIVFVETMIEKAPASGIAFSALYAGYLEFCAHSELQIHDRSAFKTMIEVPMAQLFQIGMRNDVPNELNKHQRGFLGVQLKLQGPPRTSALSEASVLSVLSP